jgi:adenylate cyclase
MTRILVVDDEADLEILIRQKFRKQIRDKQYDFVFAGNGKEALDQLEIHKDIDIILSDINMPIMDGLTLLSKLNDLQLLVKSVVVSAYGDLVNIRTAMNRGAFDFVTKPVNFTDLEVTIEKTIDHVKQLKQTLQAIKENNILKMYVDQSVLNFMNSKEYEESLEASESVAATVAFIDICGFTRISEEESPDTVVNLLNRYFDLMVKEIINQNGTIDKFIGDCIMAVFKGPYHLDRAADACLAIRNSLKEQTQNELKSNFVPEVSIGINSGEMVSGNIGSSALRRLDYTVIGDAVNIAQRLQDIAKPGQILLEESSYEKIKQSFVCEKVGPTTLRNKNKEIIVYELRS